MSWLESLQLTAVTCGGIAAIILGSTILAEALAHLLAPRSFPLRPRLRPLKVIGYSTIRLFGLHTSMSVRLSRRRARMFWWAFLGSIPVLTWLAMPRFVEGETKVFEDPLVWWVYVVLFGSAVIGIIPVSVSVRRHTERLWGNPRRLEEEYRKAPPDKKWRYLDDRRLWERREIKLNRKGRIRKTN